MHEEKSHTFNNLLTCQRVHLSVYKRQADSSHAVATILTRQISILDVKDEQTSADVATDLPIHGSTTTSLVGNSESHSEPHTSNKQAVNKPSQLPLNTCSLLPNTTKLTDHYPDIPPKILLQNKTISVDHMFENRVNNTGRKILIKSETKTRKQRQLINN